MHQHPAMPSFYSYRTPFGSVTLRADDAGITHLVFGNATFDGNFHPSDLTNRAANELLEFLAGKRQWFDVPVNPAGSAFQRAVWNEISLIPYGETQTNAQVASSLGKPDSYRVVGSAVRRNPVPVFIPGHRVVGIDGHPLGTGAEAKRAEWLLGIERQNTDSRDVLA